VISDDVITNDNVTTPCDNVITKIVITVINMRYLIIPFFIITLNITTCCGEAAKNVRVPFGFEVFSDIGLEKKKGEKFVIRLLAE
jgi:uncharacterized membrane protein YccF (DUF307 family)